MANKHEPLESRFWARVAPANDERGCWEWTGRKNTNGYGRLQMNGHTVGAHRVALMVAGVDVPDDMTVDHLCLNKACVNPAHLEVVSVGENARRWALARTHCKWGHEFTPENTRITPNGRRCCRTCAERNWRESRARRHALAADEGERTGR